MNKWIMVFSEYILIFWTHDFFCEYTSHSVFCVFSTQLALHLYFWNISYDTTSDSSHNKHILPLSGPPQSLSTLQHFFFWLWLSTLPTQSSTCCTFPCSYNVGMVPTHPSVLDSLCHRDSESTDSLIVTEVRIYLVSMMCSGLEQKGLQTRL